MRWVLCLALLAAAVPAAADAKGPLAAKICGARGCVHTHLEPRGFLPSVSRGVGPPTARRPRFLTLVLTSKGASWMHFRYRYVPAERLLLVNYAMGNEPFWERAPTEVVQALAPYVRRLGLLP
jgi:hypothetical protein